ncbi:MAG: GWxTD domain-containing protein [Acidimicrobiia bacterium]|nr:GWxTD domain-containing protein [Acidimicrobiia bacterium]
MGSIFALVLFCLASAAQQERTGKELVATKVIAKTGSHEEHRDLHATLERLFEEPPVKATGLEGSYAKWLEEDVAYIISTREAKRFLELRSDEEREQFILQFWHRRDPTPGTEANEDKEEHYRRIAFANQRFQKANLQGWQTDRGRLYIALGPPDEMEARAGRPQKWVYKNLGGTEDSLEVQFDITAK